MNKEEWIWVSIRIFGIFLLVMAILSIPRAIAAIHYVTVFQGFSGAEVTATTNGSEKLALQMFDVRKSQSIRVIFEVIVYGLFGFYFMRGGKVIHKIICRE